MTGQAKGRARASSWRVKAWVHGQGDDRLLVIGLGGQPLDAQIECYLRQEGSAILTDYTVERRVNGRWKGRYFALKANKRQRRSWEDWARRTCA